MSLDINTDALRSMNAAELRNTWRSIMKDVDPDISPSLMRYAIAQRLQEKQYGRLSLAHMRRINRLQKQLIDKGTIEPVHSVQLMPGTQVLRKWGGVTHVVLVLDNAFEYRGKQYSSLTQIAESITGAHWSGPRFFGIRKRSKRPEQDG